MCDVEPSPISAAKELRTYTSICVDRGGVSIFCADADSFDSAASSPLPELPELPPLPRVARRAAAMEMAAANPPLVLVLLPLLPEASALPLPLPLPPADNEADDNAPGR